MLDFYAVFWTTVAGLLTLGILSFLYKDNPFYKLCESIFVGVSAGYWFVYFYWQVFEPKLIGNLEEGHYHYLIAAALGLFMLARLVPKLGWLSRYALAFVIGTTAGNMFTNYLKTNVVDQFKATFVPLVVRAPHCTYNWCTAGGINWCDSLNNTVMFAGILTVLIYFFFSREHKGAFGIAARIGVYFLMIAFGASFGYTVMARISLLIGRMTFLIEEWGGVIRNLLGS